MDRVRREFHKIWVAQAEITGQIRQRYGVRSALEYLVGEKLFHFVEAAEEWPEFARELQAFLCEIHRLFTPEQIGGYLYHLERTKVLAPVVEEEDGEGEEVKDMLDHPVLAAEEILRFSRVKEMLLEGR